MVKIENAPIQHDSSWVDPDSLIPWGGREEGDEHVVDLSVPSENGADWVDPDNAIPWGGIVDKNELPDLTGTEDQESNASDIPLPDFNPDEPPLKLGEPVNGSEEIIPLGIRMNDRRVWNLLTSAIDKADKREWKDLWIDGQRALLYLDRTLAKGDISEKAYEAMRAQLDGWYEINRNTQMGGIALTGDLDSEEEEMDGKMRSAGK